MALLSQAADSQCLEVTPDISDNESHLGVDETALQVHSSKWWRGGKKGSRLQQCGSDK